MSLSPRISHDLSTSEGDRCMIADAIHINAQRQQQCVLYFIATGDSSTSTSYPASTLNQTQTSDPASTLNQTQAFPTNTSTSQTQALPTNNLTSPSLPTSTPPIHNQTSPASTLTSTTAIPTGWPLLHGMLCCVH